jgi:hypothetical protein
MDEIGIKLVRCTALVATIAISDRRDDWVTHEKRLSLDSDQ